jgi:hypothetical protein
MLDKFQGLVTSRRFWAAAIGVVAVVASDVFATDLNQEQLLGIVTIVVAWIVGDTVRETRPTAKTKNKED